MPSVGHMVYLTCLAALAAPGLAQPTPVLGNGDFAAGLAGWSGSPDAAAQLLPSGGPGGSAAVRLQTTKLANPWDRSYGQPLSPSYTEHDALYLRLWLRSTESVPVTLIVEQLSEPYPKAINRLVQLTPDWAEYRFAGSLPQAYGAGRIGFKIFLGQADGTVDVAGVSLENYGRKAMGEFDQTIDYWAGRSHDGSWRAAAEERINKIRQGDVVIRILDGMGRPVPDAAVKIDQLRHAFHFGSAVPAARLVDQTDPDSLRFQREVERLYNTITFENDLKWQKVWPGSQERIDAALAWCEARGIAVRGHNLVWGGDRWLPEEVRSLDTEALRAAVKERVTDAATRYRGRVYIWDVVNEAVTNHSLWDKIGWDEFAQVFRLARAADPTVELCYNEYNLLNDAQGHWRRSLELARQLQAAGAPLDVFGEQAHQGVPLVPLPRVLELLDEAATLGLPIEITEFDLGGVLDDQVHGEYVRDFMTACFSHPAVQAFMLWGFWEGSHWRADEQAAMFRRNWSKRPAQDAWEDLVFKRWWTHAAGTSDANGEFRTRAFYGRHKVTVEHEGGRTEAILDLAREASDQLVVSLP